MDKKRNFLLALTIIFTGLVFVSFPLQAKVTEGYEDNIEEKVQKGIRVDDFEKLTTLTDLSIEKRNDINKLVTQGEFIPDYSAYIMKKLQDETFINSYVLNREIAIRKSLKEQFASTNSQFNYVAHSDGSVMWFQNGLVARIENERVVDEFGNVSLRDTYNMQYTDDRFLISYEAKTTDELGNVSHTQWTGAYTADSVWYGSNDTNANKNYLWYNIVETDHAGNTRETSWKALSYDGKLATGIEMTIDDSVYGTTTFTRTDITYVDGDPTKPFSYIEKGTNFLGIYYETQRISTTYNDKGQVTGYEEITHFCGPEGSGFEDVFQETVTTTAAFTYLRTPFTFGKDMEDSPDPDKILSSTITTVTEKVNGEKTTETTTTDYTYNGAQELISASSHTEFSGQNATWHHYTCTKETNDDTGEKTVTYTLTYDEDTDTYSYIDPDTLETVTVDPDKIKVTDTLEDGNLFQGSYDTDYDIISGIPMVSRITKATSYYGNEISDDTLLKVEKSTITYTNDLVNNIRRAMKTSEHVETSDPLRDPEGEYISSYDVETINTYDEKGNLTGTEGTGSGHGFEYSSTAGWFGEYDSDINITYEVTLGKSHQTDYFIDKDYLKKNE